MRTLLALLLLLTLACEESAGPAEPQDTRAETVLELDPEALVHNALWTPRETRLLDDFNAPCPPEGTTLELDTDLCSGAELTQPALRDAAAGDTLRLVLWHLALVSADGPAEAHVALYLDTTRLWEERIAIPSDAQTYEHLIPAPVDITTDTAITLHLHNHGANAWRFGSLDVVSR